MTGMYTNTNQLLGQQPSAVPAASGMYSPVTASNPLGINVTAAVPPSADQFFQGYQQLSATPQMAAAGLHVPNQTGITPQSAQLAQQQLASLTGAGTQLNALGPVASGLAGNVATQGEPPPNTWLGRVKKHFWDVQMYAFLPGLALMPMALFGGAFNNYINRAPGAAKPTGWKKLFAPLGRFITDYDKKMWSWGAKISDTVKNKWGIKLGKNNFLNKIYNKSLWTWTASAANPEKKSIWRGLVKFFGAAGKPLRSGSAALNGAGRWAARFSIRSILTGLGMAGPLGWISLAGAAALTIFNVVRGRHRRAKEEAAIGAQQQMYAQQQQVLTNPAQAVPVLQQQMANNPFAQNFGTPNTSLTTTPQTMDYQSTIAALNAGMPVSGGNAVPSFNQTSTTPSINMWGQPVGTATTPFMAANDPSQQLLQQGFNPSAGINTSQPTGFSAATDHLIAQSNQLLAQAQQEAATYGHTGTMTHGMLANQRAS